MLLVRCRLAVRTTLPSLTLRSRTRVTRSRAVLERASEFVHLHDQVEVRMAHSSRQAVSATDPHMLGNPNPG